MEADDSLLEEEDANFQTTAITTPSSTTSGCISGDDTSDGKSVMPPSLITAENYLNFSEEILSRASVGDLEDIVEQCKEMVLDSAECSEERKWLVRRLIELRLRLQEAKEALESDPKSQKRLKVVLGHHFELQKETASRTKYHCDRCSGIIWSVIHSWYQCTDCHYNCHVKCISKVCRICAHIRVSENPTFLNDICPEVGLATQVYRCAECKAHISFKNSWVEPRLCDYDGRYYCPTCHWNTLSIIPARVVRNWDFTERKVSRSSKQVIDIMMKHPVINLQQLNPKLFSFVEELGLVKKIREDLLIMKKYFVSCKDALETRLLWQLKDRQHFMETSDTYSLQDLIDVNSRDLLYYLEQVQASFIKHIKSDCTLCYGHGYVCELCDDEEVIFPFDSISISCQKCKAVFHKCCLLRKNLQCPKCLRLKERAQKIEGNDSLADESGDAILQT